MNNRQKAINLLGLTQRAGKLVSGTEQVLAANKQGRVYLIVIAADTKADTRDKITRAAKKRQLPIIATFSAAEISHALGKKRKILAICDAGFAKAIEKKINEGV